MDRIEEINARQEGAIFRPPCDLKSLLLADGWGGQNAEVLAYSPLDIQYLLKEIRRLMAAIQEAPCAQHCDSRMNIPDLGVIEPCNCFKAQALNHNQEVTPPQ